MSNKQWIWRAALALLSAGCSSTGADDQKPAPPSCAAAPMSCPSGTTCRLTENRGSGGHEDYVCLPSGLGTRGARCEGSIDDNLLNPKADTADCADGLTCDSFLSVYEPTCAAYCPAADNYKKGSPPCSPAEECTELVNLHTFLDGQQGLFVCLDLSKLPEIDSGSGGSSGGGGGGSGTAGSSTGGTGGGSGEAPRCTATGPGKCGDKAELNHCNCGAHCFRDSAAAGSSYHCHLPCTTNDDCTNLLSYPTTCQSYTAETGTTQKECRT